MIFTVYFTFVLNISQINFYLVLFKDYFYFKKISFKFYFS